MRNELKENIKEDLKSFSVGIYDIMFKTFAFCTYLCNIFLLCGFMIITKEYYPEFYAEVACSSYLIDYAKLFSVFVCILFAVPIVCSFALVVIQTVDFIKSLFKRKEDE